jgi:hypothetical protein
VVIRVASALAGEEQGTAGRRRLCLPADGDELDVRPWEMPRRGRMEGERRERQWERRRTGAAAPRQLGGGRGRRCLGSWAAAQSNPSRHG